MSKLTFIITEDIDHMTYIKEQLIAGDSNPAVVVSVDPLRVAAYSPDLDSVAMLAFPNNFVDIYNLEIGTKLITVNTYSSINKTNPSNPSTMLPSSLIPDFNFFSAEYTGTLSFFNSPFPPSLKHQTSTW
jgi:hypothetical protein